MEDKNNINAELPEYTPSLGRLLNFSANAVNRYCQDRLAEHDLTLPQWVILSALWRKDGLLISDLAHYARNNPPAISRIIDRMEHNGTVRRRSDKADGRSVRVYLTKTGRSLEKLKDFYKEVNNLLLAGFTEEEAMQLFGLMEKLHDNAKSADTVRPSDVNLNSD